MINNSRHGKSYGKIDVDGWRPVSEYDREKFDWVLLKTTDRLPIIAKMTFAGERNRLMNVYMTLHMDQDLMMIMIGKLCLIIIM